MPLEKEVVGKVVNVINGDGWSIYSPDTFIQLGMTREQLEPYIEVHKSGKSPKEMIFNKEGQLVKKMEGIYGLDLLQGLLRELGLDHNCVSLGRGFRAREFCERLREYANA